MISRIIKQLSHTTSKSEESNDTVPFGGFQSETTVDAKG